MITRLFLHTSIPNGSNKYENVEYLLDQGADVNAVNWKASHVSFWHMTKSSFNVHII